MRSAETYDIDLRSFSEIDPESGQEKIEKITLFQLAPFA